MEIVLATDMVAAIGDIRQTRGRADDAWRKGRLPSFSPDGKRVVTASKDKTARVWNVFWSSLVRPENLIAEVCQRKPRGNVRIITEADVRAARILSHERVGEDVCDGVATVRTR